MKPHRVRTFKSAEPLARGDQLAWKIAEVAADPVAVESEVAEMIGNRVIDNAAVAAASIGRRAVASARSQALAHPFAPRSERAFSNLDVRNVLNVAGIFNLPAGFKLNPLVVVRSGAPYTGLIGFDTQNDANDFNDRALINGSETPRNLYRGPAFSDADLRLVKDFTLKGEGHHLDLFMDVFNVLGASNRGFGDQQVSLFDSQ